MENFIELCKARVLNMRPQQTEQSMRLGYWMDWNDPAELRMLGAKIVKEDPGGERTIRPQRREDQRHHGATGGHAGPCPSWAARISRSQTRTTT